MPEDRNVVGSSQDSRLAFRERYLNRLLPLLTSIHEQGTGLTMNERLRAVKLAADVSLAFTAGSVSWSRALGQDLSLKLKDTDSSEIGSYLFENLLVARNPSARTARRAIVTNGDSKSANSVITSRAGRAASSVYHSRVCRYRSILNGFRRRRSLQRLQQGKHAVYLRELRSVFPRTCSLKASRLKLTEVCSSRRQITRLRNVIPGGCAMDAPVLLKETADYIISLQMQVEALELLAGTCSTS